MNQSLRENFFSEDELVVQISTNFTINASSLNLGNNITLCDANNFPGANGYYLTSNGSTVYWSNVGITSNVYIPQLEANRSYDIFTATADQNTFTVSPFEGTAIDVFYNGSHLANSDYLIINTTSIQLMTNAASGDILEFIGYAAAEIDTTLAYTWTNNHTFQANIYANNVLFSGGLYANGSKGLNYQVLTSNGTSVYWGEPAASNSVNKSYSLHTATASQTLFIHTTEYLPGYIDVYYNGVHLNTGEFSEVNSTAISLSTGAASGDIVELVALYAVSIFDVSAGGSNTQVQFNSNNSWDGSAAFTFDKTSNTVHVGNATVNTTIIGGQVRFNGGNTVNNTIYTGLSLFANAANFANQATYLGGASVTANTTLLTSTANVLVGNATVNTFISPSSITLSGTAVGYLEMPINSQSANYVTVASDSGKTLLHPNTDNNARTFTIANNSTVPYANGTVISFINAANVLTIAINNDTLYAVGYASNTGSRTVNAYGMATAVKIAPTAWIISGVNMA